MRPKVGTDIVYIPRFVKSIESRGEIFLKKIFLESELSQSIEANHLAGVFAAKEAVIKALSLNIGSWLDIRVYDHKSGKPKIELLNKKYASVRYDLSISHDKDYAIAVFIIIL